MKKYISILLLSTMLHTTTYTMEHELEQPHIPLQKRNRVLNIAKNLTGGLFLGITAMNVYDAYQQKNFWEIDDRVTIDAKMWDTFNKALSMSLGFLDVALTMQGLFNTRKSEEAAGYIAIIHTGLGITRGFTSGLWCLLDYTPRALHTLAVNAALDSTAVLYAMMNV